MDEGVLTFIKDYQIQREKSNFEMSLCYSSFAGHRLSYFDLDKDDLEYLYNKYSKKFKEEVNESIK